MADHRDNTSTANIKCFIYPKKQTTTNDNDNIPVIETGTITNTGNTTTPVIIPIGEKPTTGSNTSGKTGTVIVPIPETNTPNQEEHNTAPVQTPNQEPEQTTPVISNPTNTKEIKLNTNEISDIAKQFMEQYDFIVKQTSKEYIKIGDTITLTISAKEKTTNASYKGILPFFLNIITNNSKLASNISRIQLLQADEMEISIKVQEVGNSNIVLVIDDQTIAKIQINAIY
jgi:hypothetical protein